jgi:O-antigen ligase
LILCGLVLTFSRGGLLAMVAGVAFFILLSQRGKGTFLSIALILGLYLSLIIFFPSVVSTTQLRFATADFSARWWIWSHVVEIIQSHWLVGIGLSVRITLPEMQMDGLDPHNILLGTLMETGILGLIGLFVLICVVLKDIYKDFISLDKSNSKRTLKVGLFVGLLTGLLHSFVEPTFRGAIFEMIYWFLAAVALGSKEYD